MILKLLRDVFGPALTGAYQHGSVVLGGAGPDSDIDVLAVTARSATESERRHLVDGILEFSGSRARRGPGRPVELTIVVGSAVRPWRYPPTCDFQYGEWLRADYERGLVPAPIVMPDLAPLITMALVGDATLYGPPPAEVLDPVPTADVRHAIVEGVPGLLAALDDDTRNVLLTFARIWTTLDTGEIVRKDAAADWVLAQLPLEHRPVLALARAAYLGEEQDHWADLLPAARAHGAYVVERINQLVP